MIGFDAKRIVANGTGLGSYGRTLVNSIGPLLPDNKLVLYAPDKGRDDLRGQMARRDNVAFAYPSHGYLRIMRDYWRTRGIVGDLRRDGVGIFHGLSGELPRGLRKSGVCGVVTIHDLIFMRHPEYYNYIDTKIYTQKFYATLREAERIIAISECTKRDILHYGDFPAERIDVVYQSCAPRFTTISDEEEQSNVRKKYSLPQCYMLNVGTIERRKNVLLAVKALSSLPDEVCLVIVGRPTKYADEVRRYASTHSLNHRVIMLHGVPDSDLAAIYQQARCFVYPSRYEGFGIPIIEAAMSGLPVIAATGSCLEEAGGDASLYVDPDDVEGMAMCAGKFVYDDDCRAKSMEATREHVRRFENADTARQVINVYEKALSR